MDVGPLVDEGFERGNVSMSDSSTEREVLGELLERLDVDVASVEIGERRYHRVLDSTETYTTAVEGQAAVSVRARMELRAGMVEGHWVGGASGELCGGADDAEGG